MAILDADKEGFLRSETALIQTIGRAARHIEGKVIMYADKVTRSMRAALDETNRRREKQMAYNKEHGIEPRSIMKSVRDLTYEIAEHHAEEEALAVAERKGKYTTTAELPKDELHKMVKELEKQMKQAAQSLDFERAADLRDQIRDLRDVVAARAG